MKAFPGNLLGVDTWQSTFEVNGQRLFGASKTKIAGIYKIGGPKL